MTKFLVFADLHHGNIMPDATKRFETIVQAAKEEGVDRIINLGDFISNLKEAGEIGALWHGLEIPHYMVPGNHDFDLQDEETFKSFYGLDRTYYQFEDEHFCYLVLDTNFFRKDEQDIHYANANYYGQAREYVSQEQLEWLAQQVRMTDKYCILLTHAQLNYSADHGQGGCGNHQQIHDLLVTLNQEAGYNKVCLSINGHNHTDSYACWDGIHYLDINSVSNQWLGEAYTLLEPNEIYTETMHKNYPYLKYVAPYQDALYAIVTYDAEQKCLAVKGKASQFIGGTPKERGHEGTMGGILASAGISDRTITLD